MSGDHKAADRIRGLVEADPVVLVEIAGAIANEGRLPPDAITQVGRDHAGRLADADPKRLRDAYELHLPLLSGAARGPVLQKLSRVCAELGDDASAERYAGEARSHEPPRAQPTPPGEPHPVQMRALMHAVADEDSGVPCLRPAGDGEPGRRRCRCVDRSG